VGIVATRGDAIKTHLHRIDSEGRTILNAIGWVMVGFFGEVGNLLLLFHGSYRSAGQLLASEEGVCSV